VAQLLLARAELAPDLAEFAGTSACARLGMPLRSALRAASAEPLATRTAIAAWAALHITKLGGTASAQALSQVPHGGAVVPHTPPDAEARWLHDRLQRMRRSAEWQDAGIYAVAALRALASGSQPSTLQPLAALAVEWLARAHFNGRGDEAGSGRAPTVGELLAGLDCAAAARLPLVSPGQAMTFVAQYVERACAELRARGGTLGAHQIVVTAAVLAPLLTSQV
jgi:hypothetical protein